MTAKEMIMTRSPLFAAVLLSLTVTATPALAINSTDYRCTALVDQARTAAAGADAKKQSAANRHVATGIKLCEAGNQRAAAKQFRSALKVAGVAETSDARLAAR
jgi:hypothetical protein